MRKFFKEFKEFISRGNVIDLAIALVIGTAFTAIVNAFVDDIIMPLITAIFGKADVSGLSFTLNGTVIPIGLFLQAVLNFVLIALFLFLIVKAINQTRKLEKMGKERKVTKEEKQEIAALGTVDMKDRKAVYEAALKLREQKKEAAEAEAKRQAETAETTENLLKQIRDLLTANGTKADATESAEAKEEAAEKTSKKSSSAK